MDKPRVDTTLIMLSIFCIGAFVGRFGLGWMATRLAEVAR